MIDAVRTPDPDIPSLPAKDLFLIVTKHLIPIQKINALRNSLPPEQQGKDIIDFVDSAFFRDHVRAVMTILERPAMLPELAHDAVIAERRKAEKITEQKDANRESIAEVIGMAEQETVAA